MTGRDAPLRSARRAAHAANLALLLLGILVIAVVANSFAAMDALRWRIDSTKTRAYSLSPQTHKLLASLEGQWTVALIMAGQTKDPALLRQIEEVLKRYVDATDSLRVLRIDPTEPQTLGEYESLIAGLQLIYSDQVAAYDRSLDEGQRAFHELQVFAQQHAAALAQVSQRAPSASAEAAALRQFAGILELLAQQGDSILTEISKARQVSDSRPIPDYETARSIMAEALWRMANELATVVTAFEQMRTNIQVDQSLRQYASSSRDSYDALSRRLLTAAEPLRELAPLELARIGRVLGEGDAALILGPSGATVIGSDQLFPLLSRGDPQRDADRTVAFDQRFRGEQVISSAIRSLIVGRMPTVVFVHAEPATLLKVRDDQRQDVVGVATVLQSNRYTVREWIVGVDEKPALEPGERVVWVVVPPSPQRSLKPTGSESQLVDAVDELIAEGESVLLSVYPSLLHRLQQPDAWADVAQQLSVEIDTSRVVLDRIRSAEDQLQAVHWQAINEFEPDHPIAAAMNGQQTTLHFPVIVRPAADAPRRIDARVLATIPPHEGRWLESDLTGYTADAPITDEERFDEPLPVMVAVERANPAKTGWQRALIVGSGGWMISNVADRVAPVGGERIALINPGNIELMLSGVAWLAGFDDMIAPSPLTQEVARLRDLTDGARSRWSWSIVAGMPMGCLLLGFMMWFWRRR